MKLLDYIKGSRKGKDAHRIEKEAMQDPFLSDALEGYDSVRGDHSDRIDRIQQEITRRSQSRSNHWRVWSIAASILVCISVGSYFLMKNPNPDLYSDSGQKGTKIENPPVSPDEPALNQQPVEVDKAVNGKPAEPVKIQSTLKQKIERVEPEAVVESNDLRMKEKIPASPSSNYFFVHDTTVFQKLPEKKIQSDQIALKESPQAAFLDNTSSWSLGTVKGKVIDQTGEPLAGVSVVQKGSKLGTVTDLEGNFTLKTDEKTPLVANYIGYEPKEFAIDTASQMLVAMNESVNTLDEVVVVGYGTQRKSLTVSSVTTVSSASSSKPEPFIGMKNYKQYLKNNLIRPSDSLCIDKKGTVELQFNVNGQGRPYNIVVKKSVCSSMDNEAIRLLDEGCDWSRGDDTVKIKVHFK